jgi:hypothetical protein
MKDKKKGSGRKTLKADKSNDNIVIKTKGSEEL